MNRGRCLTQWIFLMMCVILLVQGVSAEETPCEHDFVSIEIPADCLNSGFWYKECQKCGEQIDYESFPALGHDFGEWITEIPAQCSKEGCESRTCQRCGLREERTTAALGHQYVQEVQEATCTKGGKIYQVCELCGERKLKEEIPALGHDYDDGVVTKEPTERAMGRKTFTCLRCGDTRTETIPRLDKQPATQDTASEKPSNASPHGGKKHPTSKKHPVRKKIYSSKFDYSETSFRDALCWAQEKGISDQTEDFRPETVCTRAQAVLALWRAAGAEKPEAESCAFTDVSETDEWYPAVLWAVENGITAGVDETHFAPDARCTRAQIITFLYKAQGSPSCQAKERFKDVEREDYFYWPVIWAIENQMTAGVCRYYFGSYQSCTWGEFALFLYTIYR